MALPLEGHSESLILGVVEVMTMARGRRPLREG